MKTEKNNFFVMKHDRRIFGPIEWTSTNMLFTDSQNYTNRNEAEAGLKVAPLSGCLAWSYARLVEL